MRPITAWFAGLAGAVLAVSAAAHEYASGTLRIVHPVTRVVPGETAAIYLRVENSGAEDDTLLGASTPAATGTALHTMRMDGAVMRMREAPKGLTVPAGGKLDLAPGGDHLMLTGLRQPLPAGGTLPLTLNFARAGAVRVEVHVEAAPADAAGEHAQHHHP